MCTNMARLVKATLATAAVVAAAANDDDDDNDDDGACICIFIT